MEILDLFFLLPSIKYLLNDLVSPDKLGEVSNIRNNLGQMKGAGIVLYRSTRHCTVLYCTTGKRSKAREGKEMKE